MHKRPIRNLRAGSAASARLGLHVWPMDAVFAKASRGRMVV